MAQTGYTPILIYSSSTAAAAPVAGNLTNSTLGSELAINITDGKLFYKDNANAIQVIGWKTVPTTAGGTGLITYTAGDLLYYASGTTLTKLGIGAANTVLTSSGSAPQWVTSLTGLTGVSSSSITNTSLTSGRIVYSTTGGAQTDSANLVFNGSNLGLGNSSPSSNVLATLQFNSGTINTAMLSIGYGATPSFSFRSAGGTAVSPSATTLSPMNLLGSTTSDGTNFFNTISIAGIIESTPTAGSHPTGITFSTTPSGSTSRLERARIFSSGGVSIGDTTDPGAGNLRLGTGNLVIGTSGKGIDFSAASHAPGMTSELLNDYEEGTWTPVPNPSSGAYTTYTSKGRYTKVGNLVCLSFQITISNRGTATTMTSITGLPFVADANSQGSGAMRERVNTGFTWSLTIIENTSTIDTYVYDNSSTINNGASFSASIVYRAA